ncbi:hypothetical protein HU200_032578 [Digitaria exilis]|uniref:cytokinin dehydrogenase n=1 Tax=Digitaria exilis TaxID=1010633 RepID=A0A835ENQ6_9POAL|nr:hypothetical protein HU200_032578 [Digitaria exilis]
MELTVLYLHATVVALLLCFSVHFIQSPSDVFGPVALLDPTPSAARDFGAVVSEPPIAVMRPGSAADVARLLGTLSSPPGTRRRARAVAVAARGAGHSLHGQAQARGGIVVETRGLPRAVDVVADAGGEAYADVGGGALWVEVLEECLKAGLAPRSWTDYLYLTVGGTLSNGGISGQAFKHGPQISNVLQLEVVTGTGEVVTCSPTQSPELFFAVLGGLGHFETFTGDQELLVSMPELVDYVEGFMVLNEHSLRSSSVAFPAEVNFAPDFASDSDGVGKAKVYYCIEFAVHDFQQRDSDAAAADHVSLSSQQVVELVSGKLSYLRPHAYSVEVAYFDFLNRVRMEEESLRSRGLWDVPHPWLNLFVPRHGVQGFKDLLMDTVTRGEWDGNTSAVVPAAPDGVMYIFSVLRSTDPARCGGACVEGILEEHRRVADEACRRLGAKQYLARQPSRAHWQDHFGPSWDRFVARKARFDPMHVLGPGQGIFTRTDDDDSAAI